MTVQTVQALFDEIADWGEVTFSTSFDGSRLAHLKKEVAELEAVPSSGEEMADIVLILCHQARAHGVNLAEEIVRKFHLCKERRWGAPDANGIVEHLREVQAR